MLFKCIIIYLIFFFFFRIRGLREFGGFVIYNTVTKIIVIYLIISSGYRHTYVHF